MKLRIKSAILIRVVPFLFIIIILFFNHTVSFIGMELLKYRLLKNKPNVILISIDDLKADHLGCYGYGRNTSPNIDKFSQESVLFKNAFSQYPATLESHASILTSLYPNTHKARLIYNTYTQEIAVNKLNEQITTLTEIMKSYGYLTFCFGFGFGRLQRLQWTLDRSLGLEQGFDSFNSNVGPATDLNQKIYDIVEQSKNKKIFLFIHYFDVHSDFRKLPYEAPHPYSEMFTKDYKGSFTGGEGDTYASLYLSRINLSHKVELKNEDIDYIISLYDQGIAYTDSEIGKLFNFLKSERLYENSLIILLADHGEAFGEHGQFLHSKTLYDEELHIPLIVKFPYQFFSGKKVPSLVESIDILPSVLKLLNMPSFGKVEGKDFLDVLQLNRKSKSYIFSGRDGFSMIRTQHKKLIWRGDRIEFYDLDSDPKELNNLAKRKDIEMLKLFYLLDEWNRTTVAKSKIGEITNLNKEQINMLKSLGYIQ